MLLICVIFCKDIRIRKWTETGARMGGQHVWWIVNTVQDWDKGRLPNITMYDHSNVRPN